MAEKKHPVMQPIYLGMGSPMPTPRVTNSMFGKVEDAFSGRSLQFEEELKAKGKDDKKNGETEADEKTGEEKSEDIVVSGDKKDGETEADEKTEEEKSEDIVVSDDKKDEVAAVMEEVKKSEASSVIVMTCRDETVSRGSSLFTVRCTYCFTLLQHLQPSLYSLFSVI